MRDQLVDADFEGDPVLLRLADAVRARFTEQQVLERARYGYPRGSVYAEMIMTEHLEGSVQHLRTEQNLTHPLRSPA